MLYLFPRRLSTVFITLLLCFTSVAVLDLSQDLEPVNTAVLKVRLDYALSAQSDGNNNLYSSHITWQSSAPAFSPGQLFKMACDAYEEMKTNRDQYGFTRKPKGHQLPTVLTVLSVDKEIFISSSMRGQSFIYELNANKRTEVHDSLELCSMVWRDVVDNDSEPNKHGNTAMCGEVMTAQQFYISNYDNPSKTMRSFDSNKIVTIEVKKGICTIKPPCGGEPGEDKWGCNIFVVDQKLNPIAEGTPMEDYVLTGSGDYTIDQIQLCR